MTRRIPPLSVGLLVASLAAGQIAAEEPSQDGGLFDNSDVIELRLEGPIHTLIRDVDDRDRHAMSLHVGDRTLSVKARVRGKSRTRVCDFPPLRIYFGDDTAGTLFEGQRSLKLVTHCRNNDRAETHIIEEYATYRALSVLTDVSYRTRAVLMTYADTDGELPESAHRRHALFLESHSELAQRLGAEKVKASGVKRSELAEAHAALIYVFEYLVGNTDWSLVVADGDDKCCHNIDLLRMDGKIYIVPYDFDLSGIVNTPYAKPDPSLGTRSVTQRRYRGYCIDRDALEATLELLRERRADIVAELREIPKLSDKEIDKLLGYLDGYYREAENEERLLKRFERRCL